MTTAPLAAAERANLVLGTGVAALCGMAWGPKAAVSAAVGVLLAAANLRFIRRLATTAVRRVEAAPGAEAAGALVFGMLGKMVALFVLCLIAVSVIKLDVLPFTLGIMTFVMALLAAGLWWGQHESDIATNQGAA